MTAITSSHLVPLQRGSGAAPCALAFSDLSLVVPVKNNPLGICRLLTACRTVFPPPQSPREILLVDNLSEPPLAVPPDLLRGLSVRVLVCSQPGAAAARNLGARQASGKWVLFLDSDCLPTAGLIAGYRQALNGSIAYAGVVRAEHHDPVSRYYDTQSILAPPVLWEQGVARPAYLITANALVWRPALAQIGGFDERFPSAGGEDVDVGLRLWAIGPLAYAPAAHVVHAFEPQIDAFLHRFVRYGRGNRLLSIRYRIDLAPRPFPPQCPSLINWVLAGLQYLSLWWGYALTTAPREWSVPSEEVSWW